MASRRGPESNFVYINIVDEGKNSPYLDKMYIMVQINNRACKMKMDTGSPVSIISIENFKRIALHIRKLERVTTMFMSYTKNQIPIVGKATPWNLRDV